MDSSIITAMISLIGTLGGSLGMHTLSLARG